MTLPPLGTQTILVHPIYLQTFLKSRIVGPSKIMVVARTDFNCFEFMIIIQLGFTTISFLYVWTRVGTLSFFIVNIFRQHLFQYHIRLVFFFLFVISNLVYSLRVVKTIWCGHWMADYLSVCNLKFDIVTIWMWLWLSYNLVRLFVTWKLITSSLQITTTPNVLNTILETQSHSQEKEFTPGYTF